MNKHHKKSGNSKIRKPRTLQKDDIEADADLTAGYIRGKKGSLGTRIFFKGVICRIQEVAVKKDLNISTQISRIAHRFRRTVAIILRYLCEICVNLRSNIQVRYNG